MNSSSPIFLLMGPTATGKTEVALQLAKQFPVEIISVDSAMVYKGLDIGTSKPSKDILAQLPHHLVDICLPTEPYSVAHFYQDIQQVIRDVRARGNMPLLVGGTMMYFNCLTQGLAQIPEIEPNIRAKLIKQAAEQGAPVLHGELSKVDPVSAKRIHPHDTQRLIRALEVVYGSGKTINYWLRTASRDSVFQKSDTLHAFAILPDERKDLHRIIANRLEQMLSQGFINEVVGLQQQYILKSTLPAMRSVGYRQIWEYLNGEYSYDTLVPKILAATRQLAKRQSTWLRNWQGCALVKQVDAEHIFGVMQKELIKMQ